MINLEQIAEEGIRYQKALKDRIMVLYEKVKIDKTYSPELLDSMQSYKLLYETVDIGD